MSRAAVIGDGRRTAGYALAGAQVLGGATAEEAVRAWDGLDDDVALVVLTPEALAALAGRLEERREVVWAVLP